MFSKSKKHRAGKIDTMVGQNTEVNGDVVFSGGLHIDGLVKGNIMVSEGADSTLTLSENGRVEGEVRVPHIILNGEVRGDVYASEHIELAANARIQGNVYYNLLEMAMGAEVNGSLVHQAGLPATNKLKTSTPEATSKLQAAE
ncbi:MAG: polymer-forming cytoskeletal protein [Gammaproteobacteria bacterium]|nr:polymer-forming cytoskeletal protein [Gammaproteobacteria bacterium]